ncbi:MAG: hypothetical protein OQK03_01435, partial [Colwellia sp.]|nr:hypothetical protein [Colwellia sp.]
LIAVVSFALVACGGGESNETVSNNNSSTPSGTGNSNSNGSTSYVAGSFKSADLTGAYFPSDGAASGNGGAECLSSFNYNYFESEDVMVYGDPNLPDTDFKHAATLVENLLNAAFNAVGITRQEFDDYRPKYTPQVFNNLINGYLLGFTVETEQGAEEHDISDLDSDFPAPANWSEMTYNQRYSFVIGYWNSASDSKHGELVASYTEHYQFDPVGYNTVADKVVVCLDQTMNGSRYGQGSIIGMNIAPNSTASRNDDDEVVLHELIHMIQFNVAVPTEGAAYGLDRWFTEGQATYLAGQKVASSHSGHYPVHVVDLYDEGQHFSDTGLAYEHYAVAYKYIDTHNSKAEVLNMLLDIRNYQGEGMRTRSSGVSSDIFQESFNVNMHKKDGTQLTINDYRSNYHTILNN